MRKIKKKTTGEDIYILIDKFIKLLLRNGKKSKSNKLLANCCIHSDKLLKKNLRRRKPLKKKERLILENKDLSKKKGKLYENLNRKNLSIENLPYLFSIKQKKSEMDLTSHYRSIDLESTYDCERNRNKSLQPSKKIPLLLPYAIFDNCFKNKMFKKVLLTPPVFFQKSISRVRPLISLQKLRRGGRTKYIPRALSEKKGVALGIKWIITSSKKRRARENGSDRKIAAITQSIANELWECFGERGHSWQKKEELHKLGAVNKAFVRYNWW